MVRYVQFRLILGCCLGVVVLPTNLPLITVRNCRAGTIARISSRPRFSALCCYSTLGLLAICMLPSSTYKSRGVLGRVAQRRSRRGRVVLISALDLNDLPFPSAILYTDLSSHFMVFSRNPWHLQTTSRT